jgi:hypothetical protein
MAQNVKAQATAAGFDWTKFADFVKSLNWLQIWQLITEILAIFRGGSPAIMAKAGAGCTADDVECLCAHFTAIKEIAQCGEECCGK